MASSLAPNEKIVGKPGGLVEPGVKQYGFFKKAFKKIKNVGKKVFKSPLGKAALIGGWCMGSLHPHLWGGARGLVVGKQVLGAYVIEQGGAAKGFLPSGAAGGASLAGQTAGCRWNSCSLLSMGWT